LLKLLTLPTLHKLPIRILGIDPGFGRVGFGVVEKQGGDWAHVAHGCIETSPKKTLSERLVEVHEEIRAVIQKYQPDRAGLEELFFAKNAKTAMDVGQARGVILLTLLQADLPVDEFTPMEVKQAVTGYGREDKMQMQKMIALLLKLPKKPMQDDAADALAVALTAGLFLNRL
jgi:crossover junction endodeoxyribonuclease RuvC